MRPEEDPGVWILTNEFRGDRVIAGVFKTFEVAKAAKARMLEECTEGLFLIENWFVQNGDETDMEIR